MLARQHWSGSLYTAAGQRKYLTAAERARFMETALACPRADLRTLCLTLAYTGCRISEALALTVERVERDAGFIAIQSLKKRKRAVVIREIPVPDALFVALSKAHTFEDRSARLWPISRSGAWHLVKGVMREASVPD
jgi:integrase/recombinase XerD